MSGRTGVRCEFCGREFLTAGEKAAHVVHDHSSRPFPARCPVCRVTFESPADLKAHNEGVHGAPSG
ncbi:MAG: hypothetical protein L3K10_05295 [Thermoplasmata archaeon]|nr:hypothetical protein [Thermoplasmata archaeon]